MPLFTVTMKSSRSANEKDCLSRAIHAASVIAAELLREEQIIACTAEQCVCGKCGKETIVIGYESSEQLDFEPAGYFVRVTKREKRACKVCEEQGVQCAPLPARIIDKGLASDRVIIDTVVSKYADHVPIYRQSAILERETGIETDQRCS